jgi:hypothetical protein
METPKMDNKKLKIYLDETLKKTILIKEYYKINQKYEDAAKMYDIEKILRRVVSKDFAQRYNKNNNG